MKKVTWLTEKAPKYSLNEIADAVYQNFNSNQPTLKKIVMVGLMHQYDIPIHSVFSHSEVNTLLMTGTVKDATEQSVFFKLLDSYNDLLCSTDTKEYTHIYNKIGIIHNTMNCNKWANSKSRTI